MDSLVKVHVAASAMLGRVDETLAHGGAPADHPIWELLRRRGLLPGDAVANVVAWSAEPIRARAVLVRRHHSRGIALEGLSGWEGQAGAAFETRLVAARNAHEVLARNADTLGRYLDELAEWIIQGRMRVAQTLATVIRSQQAVTLTAGMGPVHVTRARAAADIGAEVLGEIDQFWVGALDLSHAWSGRLEAESVAPVPAISGRATLRAEL